MAVLSFSCNSDVVVGVGEYHVYYAATVIGSLGSRLRFQF